MPVTPPNTPFEVYRIHEEDDFSGTLADLVASYFDIDTPDASIASGYKSHRLRGDRLRELLSSAATNLQPGGPFLVTNRYPADANYVTGNTTLDGIANARLCINASATVEFSPDGNGSVYLVQYDGDPARTPGAGMQAFKDGTCTGPTLPAKWARREDVRAALPYASVAAGYAFLTTQFVSAAVPDATTEQFFHPRTDGPHPAPASKDGDPVHWAPVSRADVPAVDAAANHQPGGPFAVTNRYAADANYVAGNTTLDGIPNGKLCIGAKGRAEFSPDGDGSDYAVAFDPDPSRVPGAGMEAYKDGNFTGGMLPARWVRVAGVYDDTAVRNQIDGLDMRVADQQNLITALQTGKVEVWQPGPKFANRVYFVVGGIGTGLYQPKADIGNSQSVSLAYYNALWVAPGNAFTANQTAAIINANAPSAANRFATFNDLPSANGTPAAPFGFVGFAAPRQMLWLRGYPGQVNSGYEASNGTSVSRLSVINPNNWPGLYPSVVDVASYIRSPRLWCKRIEFYTSWDGPGYDQRFQVRVFNGADDAVLVDKIVAIDQSSRYYNYGGGWDWYRVGGGDGNSPSYVEVLPAYTDCYVIINYVSGGQFVQSGIDIY